MEMRMNASTVALQAAINSIFVCNNKSKIFASDVSKPGRDSDGCISPPAPPPPPPAPAGPVGRLAIVAEVESYNTAASPWIEAQACFVTRVRFTTTEDNHAHDCYIERSGNHSRIYATNEGKRSVHSACRMACYNVVSP